MNRMIPAAFAALLSLAGAASAHGDHEHGEKGHIHAVYPFAYASAPGAKAGGAYVSVENAGPADRLVAARADISERVEIHEHRMEDGVMKMREVEAIDLPEGGAIEMKPGGYHVMFMGLKAPLEAGGTIPVTLVFESGAELAVEVPVIERGEKPAHGHSGHSHD
ncbi:MAG: copper chaperone PCu(A)C [Pikeienuella sp.]|uniref:copper chaperone PCu(A)C n=1 Tax=Pikeienuella sp. TaxID=2831957 RepID=UPI00391DADB4